VKASLVAALYPELSETRKISRARRSGRAEPLRRLLNGRPSRALEAGDGSARCASIHERRASTVELTDG
jgi:hypothetical protein